MALRRMICLLLLLIGLFCTAQCGNAQTRDGKTFYADLVRLINDHTTGRCYTPLRIVIALDISRSMDGTLKEGVMNALGLLGRYYLTDADRVSILAFNRTLSDPKRLETLEYRNEEAFRKRLSEFFALVEKETNIPDEGKLYFSPQTKLFEYLKDTVRERGIPVGIMLTNQNDSSLERKARPEQDQAVLEKWNNAKDRFSRFEQLWYFTPQNGNSRLPLYATVFIPKGLNPPKNADRYRRLLFKEQPSTITQQRATPEVPTLPLNLGGLLCFVIAGGFLALFLRMRARLIIGIEGLQRESTFTCLRKNRAINLFSYAGATPSQGSVIQYVSGQNTLITHTVTQNDIFIQIPSVSDLTARHCLRISPDRVFLSQWTVAPGVNECRWVLVEGYQEVGQSASFSVPSVVTTTLRMEPADNRHYTVKIKPLDTPSFKGKSYLFICGVLVLSAFLLFGLAQQEGNHTKPPDYQSQFEDMCRAE